MTRWIITGVDPHLQTIKSSVLYLDKEEVNAALEKMYYELLPKYDYCSLRKGIHIVYGNKGEKNGKIFVVNVLF